MFVTNSNYSASPNLAMPPAVKQHANRLFDARRGKVLKLIGDLTLANLPRRQTQLRFGRGGSDRQKGIVCRLSLRSIIPAGITYFLSSIAP